MTCELLIYVCVNADSNVLHQFLCLSCINTYLQRLSCIHILCSLRKRGGLKKDFEFRISILCFRQRPQQVSLRPLHCDIDCFEYVKDENHKGCTFPIFSVNVPRSYIDVKIFSFKLKICLPGNESLS